MQDLVLLVADKNMHFALKGALPRHEALGIRSIDFDFRVHAGRDGGVRTTGPEMLKLERARFSHALLVLDWEGSGAEGTPHGLEDELNRKLEVDWSTNGKAIVIVPELDIWMWGSDNSLGEVLEWNKTRRIREWVREVGFALSQNQKPERPKEAIEAVLREIGKPRSSALYQRIAEKISLTRCTDPAFDRLRAQLQSWFSKKD